MKWNDEIILINHKNAAFKIMFYNLQKDATFLLKLSNTLLKEKNRFI